MNTVLLDRDEAVAKIKAIGEKIENSIEKGNKDEVEVHLDELTMDHHDLSRYNNEFCSLPRGENEISEAKEILRNMNVYVQDLKTKAQTFLDTHEECNLQSVLYTSDTSKEFENRSRHRTRSHKSATSSCHSKAPSTECKVTKWLSASDVEGQITNRTRHETGSRSFIASSHQSKALSMASIRLREMKVKVKEDEVQEMKRYELKLKQFDEQQRRKRESLRLQLETEARNSMRKREQLHEQQQVIEEEFRKLSLGHDPEYYEENIPDTARRTSANGIDEWQSTARQYDPNRQYHPDRRASSPVRMNEQRINPMQHLNQ